MNTSVRLAPTVCILALGLLTASRPPTPGRQLEALDRGTVAVAVGKGKTFVSWRLLATDAPGLGFDVYRQAGSAAPVKLTHTPLLAGTNYFDDSAKPGPTYTYFVQPVGAANAAETARPVHASVWAQPYLRVPLRQPEGGTVGTGAEASAYTYSANDASVADLDGDGQYEIILKWDPSNSKDNGSAGLTGPVLLDAYRLDGALLWRLNLGKNIRAGAHYTQFLAYDFDGDGKAEVACKTADGTLDGTGKAIGDARKDYRSLTTPTDAPAVPSPRDARYGRILAGPEYFTVFDGRTGAALATAPYVPGRDPLDGWGGIGGNGGNDHYGNRCDRFVAAVAYLDGHLPSAVMCRGYYGRTVLAAWDWRGGKLTQRWVFDSKDDKNPFSGMGNHNLSVNDVDADGRDEIVYGAMVVDDNGQGLFTTGLRHGDALHVSDFDPSTPSLEVWGAHENEEPVPGHVAGPGVALYSATDGKILWSGDQGQDAGRAMAADIDPRYPGAELWGGSQEVGLRSIKGERIGNAPRAVNFGLWWDGDLLRELLDGTHVDKWDYKTATTTRLLDGNAFAAASNNGTKATPCLSADLLGDWREEVVWRTADNQALLICTTTIPTTYRLPTLMHDPTYRLGVARENVGYNQPPHTGYFLGEGMKMPAGQPVN
ncbi:rhamnogalacturonan lyase [Hymenobacter ginkgonis]|uniref:rhamnogalacturonan lyase n=1 Tax=Hymenobacter ginkgonis TaxID=2682976 RepID=UPI0018DD4597|nr:rhamnogalacturonan lyase [Hymenobacter ginkgonis]